MSTGTAQYMSSEQAGGDMHPEPCSSKTLTGEVPHAGPTAQAVIARVVMIEAQSVIAIFHRGLPLRARAYCNIYGPRARWRSRQSLRQRRRIHRGTPHATRR